MRKIVFILGLSVLMLSCSEGAVKSGVKMISKTQAQKIVNLYKENNLGCGNIRDGVKDEGNSWLFQGEFGFTGEVKELRLHKKTGKLLVGNFTEMEDARELLK